ncbi:hypothetical protein KAR91_79280 [Candidatus Pacearchaeota archaeon]|nr:hypothetical protein [Candidatus Pacearchaeota archaeon]
MTGIGLSHFYIIKFTAEQDYCIIGKVWEMASSLLTAIYTTWFWCNKGGRGRVILDKLKDGENQEKVGVIIQILMAVVLLSAIFLINFSTFFFKLEKFSVLFHGLTLLLMVATFALFCRIDHLICRNNVSGKIRRDFNYALKNSDIPGVISFCVLAVYFVFVHNYPMRLFFSGAIAFQMLFSSFIWASTEITNNKKTD